MSGVFDASIESLPSPPIMPRKHFSIEVKREAVDLVTNANMPIDEVAKLVDCSNNTIHSWLRKYRQAKSDADTPTFVPITINKPKADTIEIVTPGGFTIRLSNASPKYIAELLHAINPC
jgi:transposase-like protein